MVGAIGRVIVLTRILDNVNGQEVARVPMCRRRDGAKAAAG